MTKLEKPQKYVSRDGYLLSCDYFVVSHETVTSDALYKGDADDRSFGSVIILEGSADITCCGERVQAGKGESFFITAGSGEFTIEGDAEVLITWVP